MCKSPRSLWRSTRRPCCFGAACYIPWSISMCRRCRQHREREMPRSDNARPTNTRKQSAAHDRLREEFLLDSLSLSPSFSLPLPSRALSIPFSFSTMQCLASQKSGLLSHYEGSTVLKAAPLVDSARRIKAPGIHRYLDGDRRSNGWGRVFYICKLNVCHVDVVYFGKPQKRPTNWAEKFQQINNNWNTCG